MMTDHKTEQELFKMNAVPNFMENTDKGFSRRYCVTDINGRAFRIRGLKDKEMNKWKEEWERS